MPLLRSVSSVLTFASVALVVGGCVAATPDAQREDEGEGEGEGEQRGTVHLRVHVTGDFHGGLEPDGDVGGAAYLSAHLTERRADAEHSLFIAAGDLIGATPLASALQHDEPALDVLGAMGLAASALGNHELDEGPAELLRLQNGGCHPDDDCGGSPWPGASFPYLAANVERDDGSAYLPASTVVDAGDARIGIVGVALRSTPLVVIPAGTEGLTFSDEAAAIREEAQALRAAGADAVLVITHVPGNPGGPGECFIGAVEPLAAAIADDVDLLVSGHSHAAFACVHASGLPVIAAGYRGEVLGEVDLVLDLDEGTVAAAEPVLVAVDHDIEPDAAIAALVSDALAEAAQLGDVVVGSITEDITRTQSDAGESALGDIVADAQLAASAELGGQFCFMNTGGLRADLTFAASGQEADGEVTYAEAFATSPFGNIVMVATFTGAEVLALLEGQFTATQGIYQVSGIRYAWSASAPNGARVDPAQVFVQDAPLDLDVDYRVTVNEYLLATPPFDAAVDVQSGPVDIDALTAWLTTNSPVGAPTEPRITRVP